MDTIIIDKTHVISHYFTYGCEGNMDWQDFRLSTRLQFSGEVIEALYSRIAEIDAVKNTFRLTHILLP